jgi:uncharacterized protein (DUF924 family)
MANNPGPADVVAFWREAGPDKWFKKSDEFDRSISERFASLYEEAAAGRLSEWEKTADGAVALILVLDQFSRNMFRGSPKTFAQDAHALGVAKRALQAGFDEKVAPELRFFLYMPLMHAETIAEQRQCVRLFHAITPDNLKFAREHEAIIRRFGRFPHRNPVLGRHTTPAEQAYLDGGGFGG